MEKNSENTITFLGEEYTYERLSEIFNHMSPLNKLAILALDSGTPKPLIMLLLSTEPLDPIVRKVMAASLKAGSEVDKVPVPTLVFKRPKGGQKGGIAKIAREALIGVHVESLMSEYGRGNYESAIMEASEFFDVSTASVRKAHSKLKNQPGITSILKTTIPKH